MLIDIVNYENEPESSLVEQGSERESNYGHAWKTVDKGVNMIPLDASNNLPEEKQKAKPIVKRQMNDSKGRDRQSNLL